MGQFNAVVKEFTDLDFGFNRTLISSDVAKKKNIDAIKASIKNLISTNHFERLFHPEIGSNIYRLLFENYSPLVERMIERMIMETVENFEPRAKIEKVSVQLDDVNAARVTIQFYPVNVSILVSFDVLLERVR